VSASWLTVPERHPAHLLLLLGLLSLVSYITIVTIFPSKTGRLVQGDAVHHYVYLRSLVFDHDLQFQNEYVRLYRLKGDEPDVDWILHRLPTGYVRNRMPIGPAIVWAPLYVLTCGFVWLLDMAGWGYGLDGYGRLFQLSGGVSGSIAASVGVWVAFLTARRLYGDRTAIWATVGLWLGSSAWYYSLVSPMYSHASSMLATGLFMCTWARPQPRLTVRRYVCLGALGGFAALVRWQDAIFLCAPLFDAVWDIARGPRSPAERWRRSVVGVLACAAAALIVFSPQMFVWQVLYGRMLTVPQGPEFMQWGSPALVKVLFSDYHGLFSWTPIAVLAVAGLPLLVRRDPRIGIGASAIIVISWYANAAAADWWAGEAFGARRFVSCFPIFVLGLTALFDRVGERVGVMATVAGVAIGLNALLLFQYEIFMKGWRDIAPYPGGAWNLWVARFTVPVRVVLRLLGS
jgi:hypothetical protein